MKNVSLCHYDKKKKSLIKINMIIVCLLVDAGCHVFVFDHHQSKTKLSKVSQSYIRTLGSPASTVFRKHWYLGSCLLFLCQAFACCHHLLSSFLVWQCMRSCSKASSFNKGFPGTQLAGAIIIIICSCCTMGWRRPMLRQSKTKWQSKIDKDPWCED